MVKDMGTIGEAIDTYVSEWAREENVDMKKLKFAIAYMDHFKWEQIVRAMKRIETADDVYNIGAPASVRAEHVQKCFDDIRTDKNVTCKHCRLKDICGEEVGLREEEPDSEPYHQREP